MTHTGDMTHGRCGAGVKPVYTTKNVKCKHIIQYNVTVWRRNTSSLTSGKNTHRGPTHTWCEPSFCSLPTPNGIAACAKDTLYGRHDKSEFVCAKKPMDALERKKSLNHAHTVSQSERERETRETSVGYITFRSLVKFVDCGFLDPEPGSY